MEDGLCLVVNLFVLKDVKRKFLEFKKSLIFTRLLMTIPLKKKRLLFVSVKSLKL